MSAAKYTLGPWHVGKVIHILNKDGGSVAWTDYPQYAPILAAAPDMAEALQSIEHSTDIAWIKELAASALAKAGL